MLPIAEQAVAALDFLAVDEWFEADRLQDTDGLVLSLKSVTARPDYSEASARRVRKLLSRRSQGAI